MRDEVKAQKLVPTLVELRYIPSGDLVQIPDEKVDKVMEILEKVLDTETVTAYYTNIEGHTFSG